MENATDMFIKIHERQQLIPTFDLHQGSDLIIINAKELGATRNSSAFLLYELSRQKIMLKSTKEYQCMENNNQLYKACIDQYIQSKMRCSLPWVMPSRRRTEQKPSCISSEDAQHFMNVSTATLGGLSLRRIKAITGCINNCDYYEYSTKLRVKKRQITGSGRQMVFIAFSLTKQEFKVETEVYTYDGNSFIADVGGFLGLLLGMGILNIYDLAMKWVEEFIILCRTGRLSYFYTYSKDADGSFHDRTRNIA